MNRKEVLMKMCGLGGVAATTVPPADVELRVRRKGASGPCPVCKEICAPELILAETTSVSDIDRTYLPLTTIYHHVGGKRCSVEQNHVVTIPLGPIYKTVVQNKDTKEWEVVSMIR